MLCSSAAILLASVDQADISNTHACGRCALIDDLGWDSHEIETLHLLELQYVCDGTCWHWRLWERRAL